MANLSIGGSSFRVEVEGDATKPAVLLAHALGADLSLWDAQMPSLLERFRVIRYDSRGHGHTKTEDDTVSIARLGRDALGILDALEIETVHFIGVSMGGAVGQWLLVNAPHRIERAILANTTATFGTPAIWNERISGVLDNGMAAVVDATMDRWFSPAFTERAPDTVATVRATLERGSPKGYADCCAALRDLDLREAIRGIGTPVLVVSGRDDESIGDDATRHLVTTIPGAKHVVLDARHIANVEADAAFSKAVLDFLTATLSTSAKTKPSKTGGGPGAPARSTTTVSRRVGTRRSTAARSPLGTMATPPLKKAPKTARADAAKSAKKDADVEAKSKIANREIAKGQPTRHTIVKRKTTTVEAEPKTTAAQASSATATVEKPIRAKPKGLAPKTPARASSSAIKTTKTLQTKIARRPSVKRPSAKALKAMASGRTFKGRTTAVANKNVAQATPPRTTRDVKSKIATSRTTRKAPAPAGKAKGKTIGSKTIGSKTIVAKTLEAKVAKKAAPKTTSKTATSRLAPGKSTKAKATIPAKSVAKKVATKPKTKTALRAGTTARRAS